MSDKQAYSEEVLIRGLRQKERFAIEALYDMYSGNLYGVILHIVKIEPVAEDVLQEAFVKIWTTFSSYDSGKGRLFTWILNLARNLAIDKVRSKDYQNNFKNQDLENNVNLIDFQGSQYPPMERIGVRELLGMLKDEQRKILELVYFQGYTQVEAADKLGIPLGTVKTRLRTGIMELRKFFKERQNN